MQLFASFFSMTMSHTESAAADNVVGASLCRLVQCRYLSHWLMLARFFAIIFEYMLCIQVLSDSSWTIILIDIVCFRSGLCIICFIK